MLLLINLFYLGFGGELLKISSVFFKSYFQWPILH
jgi:hypothetical protein